MFLCYRYSADTVLDSISHHGPSQEDLHDLYFSTMYVYIVPNSEDLVRRKIRLLLTSQRTKKDDHEDHASCGLDMTRKGEEMELESVADAFAI